MAQTLWPPLLGTLGVLLDAKTAGLINLVKPLLDRLQALHFRVSPKTRQVVLGLTDESP